MDGTGQQCAERLGPGSAAVYAQHGASLCQCVCRAILSHLRWQEECIDTVRSQPVGRALYYQATLTGRIGAVDCEGIADVIDVVRIADRCICWPRWWLDRRRRPRWWT